jgi:hypothetical protein
MGAWGEGLQANDSALDATSDLRYNHDDAELPERTPTQREVTAQFRKVKTWDCNESILGLAEWALDNGFNITKAAQEMVHTALKHELKKDQLERYRDPAARKCVLVEFRKRLAGKSYDEKLVEAANAWLFARMGRSLEEMQQLLDEDDS